MRNADGVHVWGEKNSPGWFLFWKQVRQDIVASRKNTLAFDVETGLLEDGHEKLRDPLLSGVWVTRRDEGRVHAGKRDQFSEHFLAGSHSVDIECQERGWIHPRVDVWSYAKET